MAPNYYEFLGIESDATTEEIKKKYRELAYMFHPDRNGSEEMMKDLNVAVDTLTDPKLREQHDIELGLKSNTQNNDSNLYSGYQSYGNTNQGYSDTYSDTYSGNQNYTDVNSGGYGGYYSEAVQPSFFVSLTIRAKDLWFKFKPYYLHVATAISVLMIVFILSSGPDIVATILSLLALVATIGLAVAYNKFKSLEGSEDLAKKLRIALLVITALPVSFVVFTLIVLIVELVLIVLAFWIVWKIIRRA